MGPFFILPVKNKDWLKMNYFALKTINKKSKNEGTHMTNTKMKPLALAFGASLLASVATTTVAAENPLKTLLPLNL